MKAFRAAILLFMIVLSVSSCCVWAYAENGSETTEVPLWLVLRFRDYNTGIAVSNISISAEVRTDWGTMTISSKLNETGIIEVFLGNVAKGTHFGLRRLQELELSGNYTLIKVQNVFMEDSSYSLRYYRTEYVANFTRHEGMRIELPYKALEDRHMIEGNIWVLEGDLVRVLDSNPVTGQKENLVVAPAISLVEYAPSEISELERYYFFPLDYEVTIFHKFRTSIDSGTLAMRYTSDTVSPLRVTVDENTTLINWMFHAAEEYVERQTYRMDKELEWLNSSGYPLDREHEEYQAIQSLLERALGLYREGEYMPALGGAKISDTKLSGLTKWISDLKILAILTTIGISLFAYGLASLLSSFIFEEQSANKIRLASKVLTFSLVMLMFSLSHPSLRITYALIIGSRNITLPVSLLGCFIVGGLNYFFVQLLSVRRKTMTDLALQLGVRSLKRRRSRTLLTLLTITIIVSSAIVFVDISMNRATRIKGQWQGTNTLGVLIKPNTFLAPISVHDVNWTHAQEWCKDLAYTEEVRRLQMRSEGDMMRIGILILEEKTFSANIVGIDPLFMERYYGFSGHITGFWQEFLEGEPVAIVPIELGILTNEPVTLAVEETEGETTVTRTLGEFQVVGTFDPSTAFDNLTKIDNGPLFEDPSRLVLIPINSIKDSAITISEVTILLEEGYEPVDVAEELAFTLAATTIANKDGISQKIVWSMEFSVAGLIPYIPPLIIAGLMMYTTMVSVYEERRREFTTLATLGLDPRNTFQVFLVEALLLGLMGTFLGFFTSYILGAALFHLTSFLGAQELPAFTLSSAHWSMPAILVALLTGVVMVFLGGYIPASRARGLSLLGRVKKRELIGELISEGDVTMLTLPIRETVQNGDMLYTYVRETIGKFKKSFVESHSVQGELYRDGTFRVSFIAMGDGDQVTIPCEIKGVKEGEILIPVIEFPSSYKSYARIREIIRDLEEYMIGFSTYKEMQMKMTIVREAPRRRKTIEEILAEIRDVINQVKDCGKKLRILEGQKGKLSEEVYSEFREKYITMVEEKSKTLRSMTINLEPHHKELHDEIDKIAVEVERITTAYNLGEISEEEYVKTCGPLQGRLAELTGKVQEMEEIFDFLKRPAGMRYE